MTVQTYLVLTVACACVAVAVCVFCTCICFLYLVLSIHTPVNKLIWGMRWDCASYSFNLEEGNDRVKIISAKCNDCIKKSKTAVPSLWCAVNCCVWKNHHRLYMRWLPLRLRLSCHDINKKIKSNWHTSNPYLCAVCVNSHNLYFACNFWSTRKKWTSAADYSRRAVEIWKEKKNRRGRENMLHCIETAQKSDHRRPFAVSLNATTWECHKFLYFKWDNHMLKNILH